MTRDHAIRRATQMREGLAKMLMTAANTKLPFETRYYAVIMAEGYEEAARRFDAMAEATEVKRCR